VDFLVVIGIIVCCYYSNKSKETKKQAEKDNKIVVICPHCNKRVSIDHEGEWVCPHCKKDFTYYENKNSQSRGEQKHNDKDIHVHCPYCNGDVTIQSEGTWNCPYCNKTFIYKDAKVYKSQDTCNDAVICMITLFAKLAKADGVVTENEITLFSNVLSELDLNLNQKKEVQEIFNREKKSYHDYEKHLHKMYEIFTNDREMLLGFLEQMFKFCYEDGGVHPEQEKILQKAIDIFRLSVHDYQEIKNKYIKNLDKYYDVLKCSPSSTNEEIKSCYRKQMLTYHPDKYMSKDLPEEMLNLAKEKTQEIQEAFEEIRKSRNF